MINIKFPRYFRSSDNQHSIFWLVFIIRYSVFWFLLIIIWSIFSFLDTFYQYSVCWILLINIHFLGYFWVLAMVLFHFFSQFWRRAASGEWRSFPNRFLPSQHLFLNNPAANKLRFWRGTDSQRLKIVLKIPQGMRGSDLLCNEDCPLITPSCQSLGPPTQPPSVMTTTVMMIRRRRKRRGAGRSENREENGGDAIYRYPSSCQSLGLTSTVYNSTYRYHPW